jgi:glycosyltransferase involved in cell wall biosynthesis
MDARAGAEADGPRRDQSAAVVSLVIPCYNEQAVLPLLFERLDKLRAGLGADCEELYVNDGSTDSTLPLLLARQRSQPSVRVVDFSRNFGHQAALAAGIQYARGDCVIMMDADLQDPPELVPELMARWRAGAEVVYAVRRDRREGILLRFCFWLFYRLLRLVSDTPIPVDAGDFCLMDRRVVDIVNALPERCRFLRGLRAWVGFRQESVAYARPGRAGGRTKYGLVRRITLALDGLVTFSAAPLRLAVGLGLLAGLASVGLLVWVVASKFLGLAVAVGWASIMATVLGVAALQFLCLAIVGEYLLRVHTETKARPLFVVGQLYGFSARTEPADERH